MNSSVAPIKKPRSNELNRRQIFVHSVNHHKANNNKPKTTPNPALVSIVPDKLIEEKKRYMLKRKIIMNNMFLAHELFHAP